MPETNQHIVEVLCAMWFDPKQNEWDSTYFGKYHDKIVGLGYTEKQEQKQVELRVEFKAENPTSEIKENGAKMVFRNPEQQTAIILTSHYISFHKLAPYDNWDYLVNTVVNPCFKLYQEIGLGRGLLEVQCLYLNRWSMLEGETISKYFNFLPLIEEGKESTVLFQAKYEMHDNISVQLKLNSAPQPNKTAFLSFECSTFAKSTQSDNYRSLAAKAHDQANSVYQKIIRQE